MFGIPLRQHNLLKACKKTVADNSLVSSRCSALIDVHVNKQMHALVSLLSVGLTEVFLTNNGATKSTPCIIKGWFSSYSF